MQMRDRPTYSLPATHYSLLHHHYLFYVLERYLGKGTPYAGLFDALRFILKK